MRWLPRHDRLIGMISPLMVWALYFVAVYSLAGLRCGAPPAGQAQIGETTLRAGLVAASVLALAVIALLGAEGWRGWRLRCRGERPLPKVDRGRHRFMGLVMLVLSVLATVATLITGLPILMLEPCP